jgi:hypothetical protein
MYQYYLPPRYRDRRVNRSDPSSSWIGTLASTYDVQTETPDVRVLTYRSDVRKDETWPVQYSDAFLKDGLQHPARPGAIRIQSRQCCPGVYTYTYLGMYCKFLHHGIGVLYHAIVYNRCHDSCSSYLVRSSWSPCYCRRLCCCISPAAGRL